MSNYWEARTIIKRDGVRLVKVLPSSFLVFQTQSINSIDFREVIFDVRKDYWLCLCEYASIWKGNKKNYCYHVRACQMLLEEFKKNNAQIMERWLGNTMIST